MAQGQQSIAGTQTILWSICLERRIRLCSMGGGRLPSEAEWAAARVGDVRSGEMMSR